MQPFRRHFEEPLPAAPPPGAPSVKRIVAGQASGFCILYLVLGLCAELARRLGSPLGEGLVRYLDGLPLLLLRCAGLLDRYLYSVAGGVITPFEHRLVLASLSLMAIWAVSAVAACVLMMAAGLVGRPWR